METAYYNLLYDVLKGYDRCTPSKIVSLRNNQIFVFGTNKYGSQKHGAAGLAAKSFGARVGVKNGRTGNSYALPTMDCTLEELGAAIQQFEQYARENKELTFLVTPIGCGHAGFKEEQVAPYFKGCIALNNVMLPEQFIRFFRLECIDKLGLRNTASDQKEPEDDIFSLYDDSVHHVIEYLQLHSIPFSPDGGYTLLDSGGNVIAEAELGIESEKVVFNPFNSQSEIAFKNNGYKIYSPEEYLNSKQQ